MTYKECTSLGILEHKQSRLTREGSFPSSHVLANLAACLWSWCMKLTYFRVIFGLSLLEITWLAVRVKWRPGWLADWCRMDLARETLLDGYGWIVQVAPCRLSVVAQILLASQGWASLLSWVWLKLDLLGTVGFQSLDLSGWSWLSMAGCNG